MGSRRSSHNMVGNVGIRLPSISAHSLSPKESKGRAGGIDSGTCSCLVADKFVDTGASGVESRVSLDIAGMEDSSSSRTIPEYSGYTPGDRKGH